MDDRHGPWGYILTTGPDMTYIGSALSSPVQLSGPLPLAWVFSLQCINQFERRLDWGK